MLFLQIIANSAVQTINEVGRETVQTSTPESLVLLSAMLMPFIILVVFTIVKYTVGVEIDKIDWIDHLAEMAIDLLSVFSSFIIGRFILETSSSSLLISSFKVIGLMSIGALFLCVLRRFVDKERNTSTVRISRIRWYIAAEYVIDALCLILMFIL